ncbi:MAG: DUF3488 and transglutaminase-like domain-containing protein [Actinomycetia bacterium]|nr:DUF3488 and transglutaminase-like domain-containing protein [Actinomycetes bacterium]
MVYRFSWLAGIAAIGLAFWELSFILRSSVVGTPWQLAILIAAVLGAGITWSLLAFRATALLVAVGNIAAFIITAGLLIAPKTLWTIFPTSATWQALVFEMERALEVIRYGVEPVRPVPGLVLLLAVLFWTLGFLLVAGLLNDRPFVALITPMIVALQFVIIDRKAIGVVHMAIFLSVVAFGLLAVRVDERDRGSGRLQRVNATSPPSSRPSPAVTGLVIATMAVAIGAVVFLGNSVPTDGLVTWRTPSGYSDEYSGSVSYNPYTDIKASLIKQTNNPLFVAEIDGIEPDQVRFRTVTLDVYRDGRWQTDRVKAFPSDEEPWIEESQVYRGETTAVTASIRIENLSQPWLPAPTTSSFVAMANEADQKSLRVRRLDGSLFLPGDVTYEGMEYTIQAEIARYDGATLAALARTEDGTLSPLFQAAADDNQFIPEATIDLESLVLDDEEFWTEYPDDLGAGVIALAAEKTANLETNYEKAIALEQYFRFSGEFVYNDSVPGEFTTASVNDWLTDEDNPYVRNGYCEQFATSMALMARSLGIPARVVLGFAPGEKINGNETQVLIMDRNAHSWVEIWIPRFGWMMFDPTPRRGYAADTVNSTLSEYLDFSPADYVEEIPEPELDISDSGSGGPTARFDPIERTEGRAPAGGGLDNDLATGFTLPDWVGRFAFIATIIVLIATVGPITKWLRSRRRRKLIADGDVTAAWDDITERLADLGDPVDPATTPLEAARSVDRAFVPLARTYGDALYGDHASSTAVIDRAAVEHERATLHMNEHYSKVERLRAAYRPTRLIGRWQRFRGRRNGKRPS